MNNKIIIAVDAMGGENSPKKIIDGISLSLKKNKETFFKLYGHEDQLNYLLNKKKEIKDYCEIVHSEDIIKDNESPLTAAKKNNSTSMWQAIESQKNGSSQITLSAGNTGALLILSRLILNTLDGVEKPALAGLWPNKIGMNIVLDLGANIECNDKNLIDFSYMGAALYKSLYPNIDTKIALLNVGQEEIKGGEIIKKTYQHLKETNNKNFKFCGYIEGNNIMDGKVKCYYYRWIYRKYSVKNSRRYSKLHYKKFKRRIKQNFIK